MNYVKLERLCCLDSSVVDLGENRLEEPSEDNCFEDEFMKFSGIVCAMCDEIWKCIENTDAIARC